MLTMTTAEREAFADQIRREIEDGSVSLYLSYEPGDSTHYDLVLVDMDVPVRLHGMNPASAAARLDTLRSMAPEVADLGLAAGHLVERDRWLLADAGVGFRAMTVDLNPGHYIDPTYVREKWRDTTDGSAIVLAELLNMVTGYAGLLTFREHFPDVFGPQVFA